MRFRLELIGLKDSSFRFKVREAFPLVPRFEVPYVVNGEPEPQTISIVEQNADGFKLKSSEDGNEVFVNAKPFRMDFFSKNELVLSVNGKGLLRFEHTRAKQEQNNEDSANPDSDNQVNHGDLDDGEAGTWEESFGGNTDSKPHGPQGISVDFNFIGMDHVYGVPEHADSLSLKDTSDSDPYRLYNLDVFEYELWNKMALYAAIPFMMGHNKDKTVGIFWLNAAETWIDVKKSTSGVLGSLSNMVSSSKPRTDTHWMSESGIIDAFVFLGPRPKDISRQFGKITGTTPLPPKFSIAFHQCRWNYNDQDDVRMVNEKFDEYDIPMDVMWLDIEHTDGKKYFTWDGRKFPNSIEMIQNLTAVGRKMVTIVDPHIKKDNGYWVHKDCTDLGLYVKNKDGNDYEGWCWPGASYYPDFLNPTVRNYFSEQYKLDKYQGSTLDLYTWNDMNEPSVFNGPEVTMPKDMVHQDGVEHRDVHNMYGHLYVMATYEGHLIRADKTRRPFILTRSAFAGTQKYAAIWTGDNTAEWGHLEASVPMCLSLSISGMSHVGADIGGFFGNPDGELFVRWFQAAAFQPFMRSHAHIDTKRREPWLYNDSELKLIRQAVRMRYSYLPFWYTLFFEGERSGVPPMRPVWFEFPDDEGSFGIDNEHMIGNSLLVHPISKSGVTDELVYFPGQEFWYDIFTQERLDVKGNVNIKVKYDHIPIYQRGGTIIPKQERIRRASSLMHNDPYTLYVALDKNGKANGTLYIDDGQSFDYRQGKFIYTQFNFDGKVLSGHLLENPDYKTKSWLERVVILGVDSNMGPARLRTPAGEEVALTTNYDLNKKVLIIRKPGVNMGEDWEISLN